MIIHVRTLSWLTGSSWPATSFTRVDSAFRPDTRCKPSTRGVRCPPPRGTHFSVFLVHLRRATSHPLIISRARLVELLSHSLLLIALDRVWLAGFDACVFKAPRTQPRSSVRWCPHGRDTVGAAQVAPPRRRRKSVVVPIQIRPCRSYSTLVDVLARV